MVEVAILCVSVSNNYSHLEFWRSWELALLLKQMDQDKLTPEVFLHVNSRPNGACRSAALSNCAIFDRLF